jgi:hypothetical protein
MIMTIAKNIEALPSQAGADAPADSNRIGNNMGQLRTANKRRNRALVAIQAAKSAKDAPAVKAKPIKAAAPASK